MVDKKRQIKRSKIIFTDHERVILYYNNFKCSGGAGLAWCNARDHRGDGLNNITMAIGTNYNRADGQYYINTQKLYIERGPNTTCSVLTRVGLRGLNTQFNSSYWSRTVMLMANKSWQCLQDSLDAYGVGFWEWRKFHDNYQLVMQVESLQNVWESTARQRLFRGSYQSACSTERRPEPTQVVKPLELL